jgi:hypothetical protein
VSVEFNSQLRSSYSHCSRRRRRHSTPMHPIRIPHGIPRLKYCHWGLCHSGFEVRADHGNLKRVLVEGHLADRTLHRRHATRLADRTLDRAGGAEALASGVYHRAQAT